MNLLEHAKDCTPLTPCAACEIVVLLRQHLPPAILEEIVTRARKMQPSTDGQQPPMLKHLPLTAPIDDLRIAAEGSPLSARTRNALIASECSTIEDILKLSRAEWLRTENFGRRSLTELEQALALAGYHLPERR